eukprot:9484716-Pyramimonas_sp.AAC.1
MKVSCAYSHTRISVLLTQLFCRTIVLYVKAYDCKRRVQREVRTDGITSLPFHCARQDVRVTLQMPTHGTQIRLWYS